VKDYWVSDSTPLSVEIVPFPSLRPPFQTADALRFIFDTRGYPNRLQAAAQIGCARRDWHRPLSVCVLLVLRHDRFRKAIGHRAQVVEAPVEEAHALGQ
jgi:hypothetical protein